jgi:peptidoglycan/xylan/chitin deacetylase (PgdA/CDA1 family)
MRSLLRKVADAIVPDEIITLRGPARRREVALTFDDGPEKHLGRYLDALDRAGAKATFFLLGECIVHRRDAFLEIVRRGHEVASHGFSHKRFPLMTRVELDDELDRTADELPPPAARPLVRPPQGAIDARTLAHLLYRGYRTVLWSLDSNDCRTDDPKEVALQVAPYRVRPGEIILMHEGQKWTLDALPEILDGLQGAGHSLVTVSDLLRA